MNMPLLDRVKRTPTAVIPQTKSGLARKGANPLKDTTYKWDVINQTLEFAASVDITNFAQNLGAAGVGIAAVRLPGGFSCKNAEDR